MEVIRNNKGGKRLCYEDHMYNIRKRYKSSITWMCCRRKLFNCKGTVSTDLEITKFRIKVPHTHEPDHDSVEAAKLYAKAKEMALVSDAGPTEIVKQSAEPGQIDLLMKDGKKDAVLRTIRNVKRRRRDRQSALMDWIVAGKQEGLDQNHVFRKALREALHSNNMHEEALMLDDNDEKKINCEQTNSSDIDHKIKTEPVFDKKGKNTLTTAKIKKHESNSDDTEHITQQFVPLNSPSIKKYCSNKRRQIKAEIS